MAHDPNVKMGLNRSGSWKHESGVLVLRVVQIVSQSRTRLRTDEN